MENIAVKGTLSLGPYKGYHGKAEYDSDAGLFHGEVNDTRDVITFQSRDTSNLAAAFADSVDDYLAYCQSRGEEPDKPFSGRLLVRMDPDLHRHLFNVSMATGTSLNQTICDLLRAELR